MATQYFLGVDKKTSSLKTFELYEPICLGDAKLWNFGRVFGNLEKNFDSPPLYLLFRIFAVTFREKSRNEEFLIIDKF